MRDLILISLRVATHKKRIILLIDERRGWDEKKLRLRRLNLFKNYFYKNLKSKRDFIKKIPEFFV